MTVAENQEQWVWLARIRHPQGRKGEVFADILTDFPEKFAERRQLWLLPAASAATAPPRPLDPRQIDPRQVELLRNWPHKGGIVLHFSGIDSISKAEILNGKIVAIPSTERTPLTEDEVYIADLIGCTLIDVAAALPVVIGKIEDVDRSAGPVALLVVRGAAGEILVPFAKSFLRSMDMAARRVEMALPEGLADLNAPGKT